MFILSRQEDHQLAVGLAGGSNLLYYVAQGGQIIALSNRAEDLVFTCVFVDLVVVVDLEDLVVEEGVALPAHEKVNCE